MGRPPWATPEQTAFLESFLPRLDAEKANHGLKAFYIVTARKFIDRWASPLDPNDNDGTKTLEELKAKADDRRQRVSVNL